MPPRAQLACLLALQIWDTELGPTGPGEAISTDVIIPTEVRDLVSDIIHAVRACLEAFKHRGILDHQIPAAVLIDLQYHRQSTRLRSSFKDRKKPNQCIDSPSAAAPAALSSSSIQQIKYCHGTSPELYRPAYRGSLKQLCPGFWPRFLTCCRPLSRQVGWQTWQPPNIPPEPPSLRQQCQKQNARQVQVICTPANLLI